MIIASRILKKDSNKGFSLLSGVNRPIISNQVTKLAESIRCMGVVRDVIVASISFITGVPILYVIDGQHLMMALIRENEDIPYRIIQVKDMEDLIHKIALLNSTSKSWTMLDYVTAWGNIQPDYKKLARYVSLYDFEFTVIASIMSGSGAPSGGGISKIIKRGDFRINNEKHNEQLLKNLTDVFKIIPKSGSVRNRYVIDEYITFFLNSPKYNHGKFLTNLKNKKLDLILASQETGLLQRRFEKFPLN